MKFVFIYFEPQEAKKKLSYIKNTLKLFFQFLISKNSCRRPWILGYYLENRYKGRHLDQSLQGEKLLQIPAKNQCLAINGLIKFRMVKLNKWPILRNIFSRAGISPSTAHYYFALLRAKLATVNL